MLLHIYVYLIHNIKEIKSAYMSIGRGSIIKMWSIYAIEFCSTVKKS